MKLRTKLMLCTAFVGFGSAAMAVDLPAGEVTRQAIESAYAGYERIEIKYSPSQVKVEAIDAETGQKVETIYDRATGAVLKAETSTYTGSVSSGVEFESSSGDFVDSNVGSDDNGGDDTSGSDDDGVDDTSGSDDNGGDDTSGSDDDGADDSSGGSDGGSSGSDSDDNDDSSGGNDGGNSGKGGDGGGDSSGGNDD